MVDKRKAGQALLEAGKDGYAKAISLLRGKNPEKALEGILEDTRLVKSAAKNLPDVDASAVKMGEEFVEELMPALPNNALSQVTSEIPLAPVVNALPPASTSSKLLPALATTAAVGTGTALLMDENQPEALSTAVPTEILDNANRQLPKGVKVAKEEKKESKSSSSSSKSEPIEIEKAFGATAGTVKEDDFDKKLSEAQQKDEDRELLLGMLKAAQMGGSALAGSKADTSYADNELANANKYVNQLSSEGKLKKANLDLTDENILRDPNSDASIQLKEALESMGVKVGPNFTAKQAKDQGINIGNLIAQREAINSRKEDAQFKRDMVESTKDEKKERMADAAKIKAQGSVDKMVSQLYKSEDYIGLQAAKSAQIALENAIEKGDKTSTGSAFMIYAKIAQGDNSVVRESDMKNLAGSYNYASASEMFQKLRSKAQGGNFTPVELEQMKSIAKLIGDTKAKHVKSLLVPIEARFKNYDLPVEESIDPALIREFSATPAAGLTTIPEGRNSSATSSVDPKIENYSKQYNIGYEAAKKILEKRGYNGAR